MNKTEETKYFVFLTMTDRGKSENIPSYISPRLHIYLPEAPPAQHSMVKSSMNVIPPPSLLSISLFINVADGDSGSNRHGNASPLLAQTPLQCKGAELVSH